MNELTTLVWVAFVFGLDTQSTSAYTTESVLPDCSVPNNANNNICLELFPNMAMNGGNSMYNNETMTYINSLVRKVMARNVTYTRKEVRKLTPAEWKKYTDALNKLKREKIGNTNKYDAIASLHSGATWLSAHFGPNFLGWHRIYLLILEAAINGPIPFWDSRLDYHMEYPTYSVLWTHRFFGNGNGIVTTGPFANWMTPTGHLVRNYGFGGSLITRDGIRNVLSQNVHAQITSNTSTYPYNLEHNHNNPHVWVGGHMSRGPTAPQDPVFFSHHAFIDYVWQLFRTRLSMIETNPAENYPDVTETNPHHEGRFMEGWTYSPRLLNRDGYSYRFAKLTKYVYSPITCRDCHNDAWPVPVLKCKYDNALRTNICVSAEGPPRYIHDIVGEYWSKVDALHSLYGPEFEPWYTDPRTHA